ncbi:MAG: sulfatase [Candidatus Hydrogenedentes bacterium]|nr:sulfatase [Candidatus Hydrogenedentota bacterium]
MKQITRRDMLGRLGLAAGAAMAAGKGSAETPKKPNFVVIFCDDLGYGDLACYGNTQIRTPRLDAMAAEGVRFTDFYTAAPVCSPARAALLTGRYPVRSGVNRVFFPQSTEGLDPAEATLPKTLQSLGYATACIGKWHLGHLPEFLPDRHGFDYYFGIPYSNDMEVTKRGDPPLPLMRNGEIIEQPADQDTLTRRYTEEAAAFIRRSKDRPFFLYLPHTMPHIPLHCGDDFRDKSARGRYGDVIEEIDWSTGVLLDTLREEGLEENTLVLFTSDNGPWLSYGPDGGEAGPLREGKGTTFDGGMRVPGIFRWPGRLQPRVEPGFASTLDLYPTFAALAGGAPPEGRQLDGGDILPLLEGAQRPDREFFYFHGGALQAFRSGDWKFKRPFKGNIYGKPLEHGELLFNLREDPGETKNLAEAHPERTREMAARMRAFEASLGDVPPTKK